MINPFYNKLISERDGKKIMSFGLSSFGYDIRLSDKEFYVFRRIPGEIVDPKNFSYINLEKSTLFEDSSGKYFILPANSYGLGVAKECLNVPRGITVICVGKSSYARVGVIANITPAESEWIGHLTLEFSNASSSDVKVYANEGIAQLLFFDGGNCRTSYADRNGKYQGQTEKVVTTRV
jgi:dCTP deaminase